MGFSSLRLSYRRGTRNIKSNLSTYTIAARAALLMAAAPGFKGRADCIGFENVLVRVFGQTGAPGLFLPGVSQQDLCG